VKSPYQNILIVSLPILLAFILLNACISNTPKYALEYTTSNDSTLFYYNLGWKQIMDDGFYGPAEVSYSKALSFDNDFLIGKATLARLTLDLEERLQLFQDVENHKSKIEGDERKILDVYQGLVHFTNVRAQDPAKSKSVIDSVLIIAEQNLRHIVHRYPEEIYLKSEYLEILNSRYGAKAALDSLTVHTTETQKENPFLLGFAASLYAEEGNFKEALKKAHLLKRIINNDDIPKPYAVFADVFYTMEAWDNAKVNADKAVLLDPRNLDASRLKTKIDTEINKSTE